jgi:beta-mannosidase
VESKSKVSFDIGAINSTKVPEYTDLNKSLTGGKNGPSDSVHHLSLVAHSHGSNKETYTHTAYFHPTSLAYAPLKDPGLQFKIVDTKQARHSYPSSGAVSFQITAAKAVAAWVWIDYTFTEVQGYWSDNGFWLKKSESKTVTFTIWNNCSGGQWSNSVTIRSLWDNKRH